MSSIWATSSPYFAFQSGAPLVVVWVRTTSESLVSMMNTTTSGSRRAISWVACFGQSKNPGVVSPLDTRESNTAWTIPVLPAVVPSAGPSDPARESPPIQSRSGASGVSGDRHVDAGSDTGGREVGPRRAANVGVRASELETGQVFV